MCELYTIKENLNLIKYTHKYEESLNNIVCEIDEMLDIVKCKDNYLYIETLSDIYESNHGPHFNKELAERALNTLKEHNDSFKIKWTKDETDAVASKYCIVYNNFNSDDWYYAMNVTYNLHKDSVSDNLMERCKCAYEWITDKFCKEGKAYYHYKTFLKYHKGEK